MIAVSDKKNYCLRAQLIVSRAACTDTRAEGASDAAGGSGGAPEEGLGRSPRKFSIFTLQNTPRTAYSGTIFTL